MPPTYFGYTGTKAHADLDGLWTEATNAAGNAAAALAAAAAAELAAADAEAAAAAAEVSAVAAAAAAAAATLYNNVKTFGAVGDGVADDTVAIQGALDDAAATGRAVYFPTGIYLISDSLVYSARRISMFGDGNPAPKSPGSETEGIVATSGAVIKSAIVGATTPMLLVEGAVVPAFGDPQRYLLGGVIRHLTFWGAGTEGDAIQFNVDGYTAKVDVSDITIWGVGRSGIRFEQTGFGILHCTIARVDVWQPGQDGFFIQQGAGSGQYLVGFLVQDYYVNTAGRSSWRSEDVRHFVVRNFVDNDAQSHGFDIKGCRQATFQDCIAEDDVGSGWYLDDTSICEFTHCESARCFQSQLYFTADSDRNLWTHAYLDKRAAEKHITFNAGSENQFIGLVTADVLDVAVTSGTNNWSLGLVENPSSPNPLRLQVLGKTAKVTLAGDDVTIEGATLTVEGTTKTALGKSTGGLGFFGVSGTTRPVLATGTGKTVDNVITVLQNFGLVSQT